MKTLRLENTYAASGVKSFRTMWLRLSAKVAKGATQYAIDQNADVVFCGHTHVPYRKMTVAPDGHHVVYYNTGCWTTTPSTYISISKLDIQIKQFPVREKAITFNIFEKNFADTDSIVK